MEPQPLKTSDPYYTWVLEFPEPVDDNLDNEPRLHIYSECCADTFDPIQLHALYSMLETYYVGLMYE